MQLSKISKYLLTVVLAIALIIFAGLLSFSGALAIVASLPIAIAAFFLSGTIEGEVYRENIFKGLSEMKLLGKKGLHKFFIMELEELAAEYVKTKEIADTETQEFLDKYIERKKYIAACKNKELSSEQKKHLKSAKKDLKFMQKLFIDNRLPAPKINIQSESLKKSVVALAALAQTKEKEQLVSTHKKFRMLRISVPITLVASLASGFTAAYETNSALLILGAKLGFTLSATLMSALIWPAAIFAAIGYGYLIYHSVCDALYNTKLQDWCKTTFKNCFWPKPGELTRDGKITLEYIGRVFKYGLRVTGYGLISIALIGLVAMATAATAGTWWFAVKKGITLIPVFVRAAKIVRDIFIPFVFSTQLIFSVKNSLQTIKHVTKQAHWPNPKKYIDNKIDKLRNKDKENDWQIYNPFRLIANILFLPFEFCTFIGHTIAVGLMSDRLGNLNNKITGGISAANECTQDVHYFSDKHDHGNLLVWMFKLALSPVLILAAAWDCAFSYLSNNPTTANNTIQAVAENPLTISERINNFLVDLGQRFWKSFKKSFGIHDKQTLDENKTPAPSTLDSKWREEENKYYCDKLRKNLVSAQVNKELAAEKIAIIDVLEAELAPNSDTVKTSQQPENSFWDRKTPDGKTYEAVLTKNRNPLFFSTPKTYSKVQTLLDSNPQFHMRQNAR